MTRISKFPSPLRTAGWALSVALLPLAVQPVAAQEIELRAADSLPTGHYIAQSLIEPFMERVSERTGKTEFAYFPAQQLGKAKDLLSLTQTGVTDIGYVGPSYVSDKMPLSAVGQLPEAFSTSCEGTMAYWEIAKPGGVPVQMPAPEVREALSRGTIDAGLFPYPSVTPYGMETFLDWGTQGMNFGSFVATYVIRQEKWDSLPEDVQQAITEIGEDLTREGCETADRQNLEVKQQIAEAGVTFVDLPAGDVEKLNQILSTVGSEWAEQLDAQGKPGTEILEAFRSALKRN